MLAALVLMAALVTLARSPYEAHLWTGDATLIIDLDRSFIWSPPEEPGYETFRKSFGDPSQRPKATFEITRVWVWQEGLIEFAILLIPIGLVAAALYLSACKRDKDFVVLGFACVAGGLLISGLLCVALWAIGGGWGPPYPLLFAILGVALGLGATFAAKRWTMTGL